jgi:iron complex transport system substrate-binding protein
VFHSEGYKKSAINMKFFAILMSFVLSAQAAPRSDPQRVVSLLPSLTESVCALGACHKLVGTDRYSNWPAQVQSLPKLGGLDDVQLELMVRLRPDLILLAPGTRVAARLEQLGFTVLALPSNTHEDVHSALNFLAQRLGTPISADTVWARIQRDIQIAKTQVPTALAGRRVYFEIDDATYAAGQASFIGQTLTQLGLGNIVPTALGAFPKLNPEFVVRYPPDIIMARQTNLEAMASRPGWNSLPALKQKQSCGFSSVQYELLIRPGPRLGQGAQQLAQCLAGLR